MSSPTRKSTGSFLGGLFDFSFRDIRSRVAKSWFAKIVSFFGGVILILFGIWVTLKFVDVLFEGDMTGTVTSRIAKWGAPSKPAPPRPVPIQAPPPPPRPVPVVAPPLPQPVPVNLAPQPQPASAVPSPPPQRSLLAQQKDDFDKFCKPSTRYAGSFSAFGTSCNVRVVFESHNASGTTASGTIAFLHSALPGGEFRRPFSVSVNTSQVIINPVIP